MGRRGRAPCCEKVGLRKGSWTPAEDTRLIAYIQKHGHGNWRALPKLAGLLRCGKSCRLRWINYLRPDVKRGNFTKEEEDTIIKLQETLGNKWSKIASRLPGRTDNEIKNVFNTHLKKRLSPGGQSSSADRGSTTSTTGDSSGSCRDPRPRDGGGAAVLPAEEATSAGANPSAGGVVEIPVDDSFDVWNVLDGASPPSPLVPIGEVDLSVWDDIVRWEEQVHLHVEVRPPEAMEDQLGAGRPSSDDMDALASFSSAEAAAVTQINLPPSYHFQTQV